MNEDRPTFRKHGREMYNDYFKVVEVIDVELIILEAVVCPYLSEELLTEDLLDDYNPNCLPYYFNIVEAFDKTWVSVNSYGDGITTVSKDKSGVVYGTSQGIPSPDLSCGQYYNGDEVTYMGKVEPYESDQSWLWGSVQLDCKTKCFPISKETLEKFITNRKDYLEGQVKLQRGYGL